MRLSAAFTVLAALALMSAMPEARAQEVVADLSSHLVAITTGFTGTSVVLFGSVEGSGDVIVVVNGPARDIVVRHKSKIAAVWINTSQVIYQGVPSFYSVASSKPPNEIAPPALRQMQQIGIENLRLTPDRVLTQAEAADFRAALIRNQQRAGLYVPDVASVSFLGNRLFRATIAFPANVPTGNFLVQVFLIRNGAVVGAQTVPLVVSQVGLDARVHDFADRFALAYGIIAVGLAAIAGWLASLPFRNA
jgi:uncharacterized protein (TIGR02186 family)